VNCKKVRRWLPLFIGSEISERKIRAVKAHLERCPECKQEYESCVLSLGKVKEWLKEEKRDFKGGEWEEIIREAVEKRKPEVSPLIPWPFKKVWAYALMAAVAVLMAFFATSPFLKKELNPEAKVSAALQTQDVISITLVSQETGLKIFWFFDKNFELKEAEE
jgi:anti-sigma factor RsiW